MRENLLGSLCQRYNVDRRLFYYFSLESFLMKQNGTRLKNKTRREIMSIDREKLRSKDCFEVYASSSKLTACQNCKKNNILPNSKPAKFCFTT